MSFIAFHDQVHFGGCGRSWHASPGLCATVYSRWPLPTQRSPHVVVSLLYYHYLEPPCLLETEEINRERGCDINDDCRTAGVI